MKLREFALKTNQQGELVIPDNVLMAMGIGKKEEVYISYFSEHAQNSEREFLITRNGVDTITEADMEDTVALKIPLELLDGAGIPYDSDLDVVCTDRKITILPVEDEKETIPAELFALCRELGIEPEKVSVILKTEQERSVWDESDV